MAVSFRCNDFDRANCVPCIRLCCTAAATLVGRRHLELENCFCAAIPFCLSSASTDSLPVMRIACLFLVSLCLIETNSACSLEAAESWPQFRGPHGAGLAAVGSKLPAEIGPQQGVIWKIELPPGHSSPVVDGDRIFVTAVRDKHLLTLALDRETGKTVWEVEAPHTKLEPIHKLGSSAQPTQGTHSRGGAHSFLF